MTSGRSGESVAWRFLRQRPPPPFPQLAPPLSATSPSLLLFALVLLPEVKMVAFTAEADLVTGWCLFGLALLVGGINEGFGLPFLFLPVPLLSSPLTKLLPALSDYGAK